MGGNSESLSPPFDYAAKRPFGTATSNAASCRSFAASPLVPFALVGSF